MTSLIDERLGTRRPTYRSVPPGVLGAGEEAADLAALAGLELDGWQQDVLDWALAKRERDGHWAAFEVGLIVPRQNGKGSVLEALELAGLFRHEGTKQILHSAHEFKTAKEAFRRIVALIKAYPRLEKQVDHIRYTTGEEGIVTNDGSRLRFVARSSGSGRGFTADLIVLDEAYNLSVDMMAALLPTLSARPNPQLWYTSSAPLPHVMSDVLRRLCKRGRAGTSKSLAYFEWCAPDDAELEDPGAWAAANPALGIRISEEFVAKELEALGPEEFPRERLGIWHDLARDSVFGHGKWEACADPEAHRPDAVCFAFDLAPGKTSASIAVAGRTDDRMYVDVAVHDEGTDWLVGELKRLKDKHRPDRIVCDEVGPSGALLAELERTRVGVEPLKLRDIQQACGALFLDVVESRLVHPDIDVLNAAVFGAEKREVGDAWLWSRKKSDVDISPLVAVTLARWAAAQPPAKRVLTEAGVW